MTIKSHSFEAFAFMVSDITQHHIDIMAMCCRVISPFYFCSFSYVIYV